jgi:hypothetical protein
MKATQLSIVMYGHDARLLETRKWVLHSLGYPVQTVQRLSDLNRIPATPPVALLVLCHTLTPKECQDAIARASSRWPGVQKLALVRESSKAPCDVVGKVLQTLDIPARMLTTVRELVGCVGSSTYSHIY